MMSQSSSIPSITALSDISDAFDVFLLDQFGVLHNGQTPYPGAIAAVEKLKAAGKTIVILSNSGKRARPNELRLSKIGFDRSLYDHFISSGEVSWQWMRNNLRNLTDKPHPGCLLFTRDNDHSAVNGLDLRIVADASEADLILITASEGERYDEDYYHQLLHTAAARGVPAICTNPDKIMLLGSGPHFGAGRIAEIYQAAGGSILWLGKPYPEIYAATLALLENVPRERILCVGDSIEHDIAGARNAGLHSLFITQGIYAGQAPEQIAAAFEKFGVWPDFQTASL